MPDGPVLFIADLAPGTAWLNQAITMGYDRCAETLIDEKVRLLEDLHRRGGRVFYTHDPNVSLSTITRDERGRFCAGDEMASLVQLTA